MKNITIIIVFLATILLAQNTVEDLENQPVVDNLALSVIDMPLIEDISEGVMQSVKKTKNKSQESNQSKLEMINGVIRKKITKSEESNITKLDEEVEEVENLEPAGITSLQE